MTRPYLSTDFFLVIPIYRNPTTNLYTLYCRSNLPGILARQRRRVIITEQIEQLLAQHLSLQTGQFLIRDDFWLETSLEDSVTALLVDLSVTPNQPTDFITFPQALQQMAQDRSRLIFLKAWQVLSGCAEEKITAITDN